MRQRAARHQQLLDSKHKPVYPSPPTPLLHRSQKTALAASCSPPAQPSALGLLAWMEHSSPSPGESWALAPGSLSPLTTCISAGLAQPLSPSICARHACLPRTSWVQASQQEHKCLAYEGAHYLSQLPCAFFCTMTLGSALSPSFSSRALTPPYHSISVTGMQPRVG